MAHVRQLRPDSGFCFQVKVLKTFQGVPSSLGNGAVAEHTGESREELPEAVATKIATEVRPSFGVILKSI